VVPKTFLTTVKLNPVKLMKTNFHRLLFVALALLALSTLNSQLSTAFAQGNLTPSGPPVPTMKSLDQIEARTPISSVPITITTPGSYYLTTNLYSPSGDGITVSANDVTIDLNGFALVGNGVGSGIVTPANVTNLFVRNGTVRNWGASSLGTSYAINSRFEKLRLSDSTAGLMTGYNCEIVDCACWNAGNVSNPALQVSDGCVVRNCVVAGSGYGILGANGDLIESCLLRSNTFCIQVGSDCTIRDCAAIAGGGTGINAGNNATIQSCQSLRNQGGGIMVGNGSRVQDCAAIGNTNAGIFVYGGTSVSGCTCDYNGLSGIYVYYPGCAVINNTCTGNNIRNSGGDSGIYIDDSNNRVDGNHLANNNGYGIDVNATYANNVVIRNDASDNLPFNYYLPASADAGPLGTAATATSPWANISY
jgi:parallel beta-helix repeat protein